MTTRSGQTQPEDVLDGGVLRPVAHLHHAGRQHRDAWRRFDRALSEERRRGGRWWPDYVHAPLSVARKIAEESQLQGFGAAAQPHILAALAAWRPTQGIYRFHPSLLDELWKTPVTGELPAELFRNLPEWCVYVEAPDRDAGPGLPIHGFFAHLAPGEGDGDTLELLFDMRVPMPMLAPKRVLLNGTVADSVAELARRSLPPDMAEFADVLGLTASDEIDPLSSILSLLLYLCSEAPDLRDATGRRAAPGLPTAKAPRRRGQVQRFAAASTPTVWETAFELGRRLEEAQERAGEGDSGRTVRPHVRRAHWHTYWSGAVNGARVRRLRWISPLLINAKKDAVEPTVRKVGFDGGSSA